MYIYLFSHISLTGDPLDLMKHNKSIGQTHFDGMILAADFTDFCGNLQRKDLM